MELFIIHSDVLCPLEQSDEGWDSRPKEHGIKNTHPCSFQVKLVGSDSAEDEAETDGNGSALPQSVMQRHGY